jgi:hypothetical protein
VNLERDQTRLLTTLQQSGFEVPMASSADGDIDRSHAISSRAQKLDASRSRSPRWQDFRSRSEDEQEAVRRPSNTGSDVDEQGPSKQTARRASIQFPSSLASSTMTNAPPLSSDSATFKDSFTPTTTDGNYPFDSPSNHLGTNAQLNGSKLSTQPPPLTRMLSGTTMMPTSTSPTANAPNGLSLSTATKAQLQPSPNSLPNGPNPAAIPPSSGPSDQEKSKAKDAATSAAKSFRVTLEDPCWKVLPAALKKYKINDDWKKYALFICFGNTGKAIELVESTS